MPFIKSVDYAICKQRRELLVKKVSEHYPQQAATGMIVLFAGFEKDCVPFKQEPSFYYFTGIEEPASVCVIDLATSKTTLYVPNFGKEREKWVAEVIKPDVAQERDLLLDDIQYTGKPCAGYQCHPFFTKDEYASITELIQQCVDKKRTLFTLNPSNASAYVEQRFILLRMMQMIPGLSQQQICDIASIVARLRRKKEHSEIELLYQAIDITIQSHECAAQIIKPGKVEYEVQAGLEYFFASLGGRTAFPTIVGSGKNSTILHYMHNNSVIDENDLVVIDCGAEYNYYCADITRTYPAAGTFSKRQMEIYNIVLETQSYIATIAKPGMWLSSKEKPDQSLNHLAKQFLKEKGYAEYFPHGIGHFLGLDVHDVGDYAEPLEAGDVITIEPGIYIPDEKLGIRIEDDYWIVKNGAICLSENLVKTPEDIEALMRHAQEHVRENDEQENTGSFEDEEPLDA